MTSRLTEAKLTVKVDDRIYSDCEWDNINQLARQIDKQLLENDVRLTMGGEPTFVAKYHTDHKEWCTEALGNEKIILADQLLQKLKTHFGKGALHHYPQGKWYPHEAKPRWSFNAYWRIDNQAIWQNQSLLNYTTKNDSVSSEIDKKIMERIAYYLAVDQENIMPAYEDKIFHLLKQEKSCSSYYENEKFFFNEQQKIQNILLKNLDKPKGYVLPLHWSLKLNTWISNKWEFNCQKLFLIPGEFAIGYRLPLNHLPINNNEYEPLLETSLFDQQHPLLPWNALAEKNVQRSIKGPYVINSPLVIPTALCTEIRHNKLFVFIPPIPILSIYLDLITAIELATADLKVTVVLEGFAPPTDLRLQKFSITPDPGVLEVNIHPAHHWEDIIKINDILFLETHALGLTCEKYLLDGRVIGTGGGNHITLGGITPNDSPFLRNPALLQSMITFWQHHPALSYLFSGLFIGPTSQAPRIDEARHESLYELEISFEQLVKNKNCSFWNVDRLLRNLLVDVVGNNHRAEFCIDKLFSPTTEYGRQGLLELRAIEMMPHKQMNLVIYLLIRAFVSYFWQHPYQKPLIRWGTTLHDQFMLPYFIWNDFQEIINYLNQAGYSFNINWFQPFYNFRFPLYGKTTIQGINFELRMALEPWSVLGEDTSSAASSRAVDSAIERVQITITGLFNGDYIVTCNNYCLPLYATGKIGEYVAGIRFKAWPLIFTLHPTLPPQTVLEFQLIDKRKLLNLGGFNYYLSDPMTHYEKRPENAQEAKRRLHRRFKENLHFPMQLTSLPLTQENLEYPYTLDLRRTS